jgi:hypothetical protein
MSFILVEYQVTGVCLFTNSQIHFCDSFQCLGIIIITNPAIGISIIQNAMFATTL